MELELEIELELEERFGLVSSCPCVQERQVALSRHLHVEVAVKGEEEATLQETHRVARDINPKFNKTITMGMLGREHVLLINMVDTGLFANEHLGGGASSGRSL